MADPIAALLNGGERLHLQHGPIDLIIGADPLSSDGRERAFAAAVERFQGLLETLVEELPLLRSELHPDSPVPIGPVARRMHAAAHPYCGRDFVTSMAAVAGSVADEILSAMISSAPLRRAYVNNGGDIAIYLNKNEQFTTAMVGLDNNQLGLITLMESDGIGGLATSGSGGRSHSFGIADSVTVLAASAAQADVAATLIANAVNIIDHPAIRRRPASELQPDSDLGDRLVVTNVGSLSPEEIKTALSAGATVAANMMQHKQISGAALFLRGEQMLTGPYFRDNAHLEKVNYAKT